MGVSNVVSISGGGVPEAGQRNDDIVAAVREILERAEAGEIQALAYAHMNDDSTVGHGFSGDTISYALVGALHMVSRAMMTDLAEDAT